MIEWRIINREQNKRECCIRSLLPSVSNFIDKDLKTIRIVLYLLIVLHIICVIVTISMHAIINMVQNKYGLFSVKPIIVLIMLPS